MLVLTRKTDEAIVIGDGIRVTVLGVEGGQVRLGVSAPRHVGVHRGEVYERILQENRLAAAPTADLRAAAGRLRPAPGPVRAAVPSFRAPLPALAMESR